MNLQELLSLAEHKNTKLVIRCLKCKLIDANLLFVELLAFNILF